VINLHPSVSLLLLLPLHPLQLPRLPTHFDTSSTNWQDSVGLVQGSGEPTLCTLLPSSSSLGCLYSSPAYSTASSLLAFPLPSHSPCTLEAFPLFPPLDDPLLSLPSPTSTLQLALSHLSSPLTSALPSLSLLLSIPLAPNDNDASITHLSFSPTGHQLLAVSSSPTGGDVLTLFEHHSACVDDGWDVVLQERLGRLAPGGGGMAKEKRVLSVRWVGEPRRVRCFHFLFGEERETMARRRGGSRRRPDLRRASEGRRAAAEQAAR
jgi:hypothetical protein